jgi:hypothetical protein
MKNNKSIIGAKVGQLGYQANIQTLLTDIRENRFID